MKVSVVVALFNEEESVPSLIESLRSLMTISPDWTYEFVFVDDASTDKTVDIINQFSTHLQGLELVRHKLNLGFGGAFKTGIQHSTGDVVVCYDADCTYPTQDIIKLVKKLNEGYDLVTADPFSEAIAKTNISFFRKFLTKSNTFLYRLVLGRNSGNLRVFSCAFRAYTGDPIRQLKFRSLGFGAASEILGRYIIMGKKTAEVPSPLSVRKYGKSKMKISKAILDHLKNLLIFFKIRLFNY